MAISQLQTCPKGGGGPITRPSGEEVWPNDKLVPKMAPKRHPKKEKKALTAQ